jgi:hypothetical protein
VGKVTVLNGKGDKRDVDESALPYLQKLGWREETTDEAFTAANTASREDYYSGFTQTAKAFGEGAIRGASLGLINPDSEQAQFREEYHPVASTAGEITGIVAPAVLSGGAGAAATGARLTPAGIVARGAEKIGADVTKRRVGQLAVAGTLEGVGQATGGLVGRALAGDEVTPEAITHELGMGALFGLGGGIAARGIEMGVDKIRRVVTAADEKAAMSAVDDLLGEEAPRPGLYDSPAAYSYSKGVKGAIKDADSEIVKRIQSATDDYERAWQQHGVSAEINSPSGYPANDGQFPSYKGIAAGEINVPEQYGPPVKAGSKTQAIDFNYADEVAARAPANGPMPERAVYRFGEDAHPGVTLRMREPGPRTTTEFGAPGAADDLAAIKADGSNTGPLRVPSNQVPRASKVIEAAEDATPDAVEDLIGHHNAQVPKDTVWGEQMAKRGKEIIGMIQARNALKEMPDLSLDSLSRMTLDEVGDVAKKLDTIGKYAPDVAARLDASMREALGKAAPGLRDFDALDVLGYHKVSEDAVAKLAEVHDSAKNVVALWSTLKAMDGAVGKAAGKSAAKAAIEAGTEAAKTKGILTNAVVKRTIGKAAGAMLGGSAVASPIGWVAGWAVADVLMGGATAAKGVAGTITATKRKALLATAKGLKALTGRGRPAAVSHMATRDKLAAPISLSDTTHEEAKNEQALVAARIEQASFAASSAGRERLADVLTPLRAKSPELAAAMEQDARRRAEYLARYAPRKPAWAAQMGGQWQYPQDQIDRFAAVYRAVTQPASVLEDFGNGTLTPDAAAAWRETSPGMYKMVAQFVMEHFDPSEASYAERFNVSMLLGAPMDPTMHMVPSLQGDFVRNPPQGTSLGGGMQGGESLATGAQRSTER